MSSEFTSFSSGDPIAPGDINQFIQPINDLETGAALYRVATGSSGSPYLVDFTRDANQGGHFIATTAYAATLGDPSLALQAGQVVIFKADVNSPSSASLQIKLEDGSTGTNSASIPLHVGNSQIGSNVITADQIVMAVYNDTSTPRFDIVSLSTGGPSASAYQVYNWDSYLTQTISSTSWTSMTGCSGGFVVAGTTSEVVLNAHHSIEAYPGYGTNRGQWRLQLSKSGSSNVYLPSSTGQTQTSPYNLVAQNAYGGSWRVSGLAAGSWTVTLQMQANSSNYYYGQTANTHASCTAIVINS